MGLFAGIYYMSLILIISVATCTSSVFVHLEKFALRNPAFTVRGFGSADDLVFSRKSPLGCAFWPPNSSFAVTPRHGYASTKATPMIATKTSRPIQTIRAWTRPPFAHWFLQRYAYSSMNRNDRLAGFRGNRLVWSFLELNRWAWGMELN
jgi:hypothetical protein